MKVWITLGFGGNICSVYDNKDEAMFNRMDHIEQEGGAAIEGHVLAALARSLVVERVLLSNYV